MSLYLSLKLTLCGISWYRVAMPQLRQVSPLFIFALISLLYCSPVCVATGHAHAAVSSIRANSNFPDETPCHPPSTTPWNTSDSCTDCGDHFFLIPTSSGTAALSATATASSTFCVFASATASLAASPLAYRRTITQLASSPPRYLSLSVLRL
jgi:hypothetical protein